MRRDLHAVTLRRTRSLRRLVADPFRARGTGGSAPLRALPDARTAVTLNIVREMFGADLLDDRVRFCKVISATLPDVDLKVALLRIDTVYALDAHSTRGSV